jgi:transcriptional regulator with XRE-family HTH domain
MPRTRQPTPADEALLKSVGERIRSLRAVEGLTQEALAWDSGLSKSYLSEIEAGRKAPSLYVLRALAERLGVGPGVLLDGAAGEVVEGAEGPLPTSSRP